MSSTSGTNGSSGNTTAKNQTNSTSGIAGTSGTKSPWYKRITRRVKLRVMLLEKFWSLIKL